MNTLQPAIALPLFWGSKNKAFKKNTSRLKYRAAAIVALGTFIKNYCFCKRQFYTKYP